MPDLLKVLIVDDMATHRNIIMNAMSGIPGVNVIGTASNGRIALSRIAASRPDLVLLDLTMPVMDGLETLKRIRTDYPDVDVVMVSGIDRGNANLTVRALGLGALDFVAKPQGATHGGNPDLLRKSLAPIISLVKTRKYSRRIAQSPSGKPPVSPPAPGTFSDFLKAREEFSHAVKTETSAVGLSRRIDAVGIGVSTGGPTILQKIIPRIEKNLCVPIFAVQHMPPMFTQSLAERLDRDSAIAVEEARDGSPIEPGKMYIAPGGRHLVVRRESLGILDLPPVNNCRPSVDVLFQSMVEVYGGNILAVILTGMGRDGAAGVAAIRWKGGYCIVQNEATSVVWGMPQAVVETQNADEILPADRIAQRIMEIVGKGDDRPHSFGFAHPG